MTRIAWNAGLKHTDETKQKISAKLKGRTPWNKGKVGVMAVPWNKGTTLSEEHKAKIASKMKGKQAWNKGQKWSEETKAKIKEGMLKKHDKNNNNG